MSRRNKILATVLSCEFAYVEVYMPALNSTKSDSFSYEMGCIRVDQGIGQLFEFSFGENLLGEYRTVVSPSRVKFAAFFEYLDFNLAAGGAVISRTRCFFGDTVYALQTA